MGSGNNSGIYKLQKNELLHRSSGDVLIAVIFEAR